VKEVTATGDQNFWEEDLAGSNAGHYLMGADNTIRWIDDPELRRRLNVVIDGIEECHLPNGYIMAYPEESIFYSERGGYTRAWLTHGATGSCVCRQSEGVANATWLCDRDGCLARFNI
jgi:DUF1680 family protein